MKRPAAIAREAQPPATGSSRQKAEAITTEKGAWAQVRAFLVPAAVVSSQGGYCRWRWP
jgi:hypothetical protein